MRYLTDLRFCCAANVVTASEARDPDVYRDCSNRLLGSTLEYRGTSLLVGTGIEHSIIAMLQRSSSGSQKWE